MVCQRGALLILMFVVNMGLVCGCVCPAATILSQFPSEVPADVCCLNYSGSAFSHVHWSVFTNETNIVTLDLSFCNISSLHTSDKDVSSLQKVYLGHNRLTVLPREFLAGQPNLTELDLSGNLIQELPEGFLQASDGLQKLNLYGNQLRLLPGSVLQKPSLQTLELDGNPWDCSCLLLEGLEEGRKVNRTAELEDLVGNLTCVSPRFLAGRTVLSVTLRDVCRPAALTALFIVLPLLILSGLAALLVLWEEEEEERTNIKHLKKESFQLQQRPEASQQAETCSHGAE
ncbi:chondroadherin-like protein [Cottoperca gobio]|uniref:Chondroadherin-like protein n=1 Tax=Cottoperca gobio TaxID=56716 RepID=A0A6J2RH19_COTGO|nr:chondroadherin-like protein [Cottoperca gobio]XP_029310167.1 chondroadherin-like protein [Cottoperca gobio]XP_029310168.1 chondroadherin-like protein [Cottoperca gobio]XP_029310169.1 chondroadherin-like protein [Cottoperca gobio]